MSGFEATKAHVFQRIRWGSKDQEVEKAFAAFFIAAGKEEMFLSRFIHITANYVPMIDT